MSVALPDIPSPPTLCAPVPAMLWFRTGLATGSPWGLPAVLRTSFISRSLVSRIWPYRVCVVGRHWTHRSTDYLFTFSCSPPHLAVTQLLSVTGGELHQGRTFHLPAHAHSQAHIGVGTGNRTPPLPPNRTGEFLAYGSPVSGPSDGSWPLGLG
jgi:hypothetical protein